MKSARSFKEFEALNGISMEEVLTVFEAVSEAFPMIVAANLTKNTYTMIKDDGFLANDMPSSGKYDDLIDVGVENIHPNYQRAFLDNFSRERLLQMLGQGRKEVCVKLYQNVNQGDKASKQEHLHSSIVYSNARLMSTHCHYIRYIPKMKKMQFLIFMVYCL